MTLPIVMAGADRRTHALRAQLQDLMALMRDDATPAELARIYAVSVTANRAANLRAMAISQVPFRVVDRRGEVQEQHPLNALFRDNAGLYDLLLRTELTLCFWGHNVIVKQRMMNRRVYGLRWINPKIYTRDIDLYEGLRGFRLWGGQRDDWGGYIPRHDAVFMIHNVDFDDDFGGVSPAEAAFDQAGIETEAALTAVWFLRNRAVPAALLQPEENAAPSESDARWLRNLLQSVIKGARNAGKTIVSPHRWEWVQLQQQFDEIGMGELTDDAREAIAMAFGVPLDLILPTSSTYAELYQSTQNWRRDFVKSRCRWYADQFTAQVAREFGDDIQLEPAFDAVFEEDEKANTDVANQQLQGGYLTLYDAQVKAGHPKPDERLKDIYLISGQPVHVDTLIKQANSLMPVAVLPGTSPSSTPLLPSPNGDDGAPVNLDSTAGLNGAQITAALEILSGVKAGTTAPTVAYELLVALGIESGRAQRMVDETEQQPGLAAGNGAARSAPEDGNGEDEPSSDEDWLPDEVFKELRDCVRVVGRRGAEYAFQAEHLPVDVVALVRLLVATGAEDEEIMTAARNHVQTQRHAIKAYGDVEATYRATLYDLIRSAFARQVSRQQFGDLGRIEIEKAFESAFLEGVNEAGVATDTMTEAEASFVHQLALAERRNWTRLANRVYKELVAIQGRIEETRAELEKATDPDEQERLRAELLELKRELISARDDTLQNINLWAQGLRRIYAQGQLSGKRNQMLRWDLDPAKENCRTCRAAHGQIHRASDWGRRNLHPGSEVLECVSSAGGVPVCGCGFTTTDERARGRLDRIPLFAPAERRFGLKASYGEPSGSVVLYLDEIQEVLAVQEAQIDAHDVLDNVRWMPADYLHLTLAHSPLVDELPFQEIFEAVTADGVPSFTLRATEVDVFGDDDTRAIVLHVEVDDALRALQRRIVEEFENREIPLSQYSAPEQWRPHITLGYEEARTEWSGPHQVAATSTTRRLAFSRGDYRDEHVTEPEQGVVADAV